MHRRPVKIDREATKAAKFLNRFSYVSLRVHPGTSHQCQYLAGKDVEVIRMAIFERSKGHCENPNCQVFISWETFELDHREGKRKVNRCWCKENLCALCRRCHRAKHHREVMLRDLRAEQGMPGVCHLHPKAVFFDGTTCPACDAEKAFLALTDTKC